MASFRTHISFGIALGIVTAVALVLFAISKDIFLVIAVFTAAALGSILPDIDSDSGIPFHITFGSLSIAAGALVFASLFRQHSHTWTLIISWTGLTVAFIWIIVGHLFARFTRHRGMAHSIPAAILAGLVAFMVSAYLSGSDASAFILGISVCAGFMLHLILDELHAGLNFHGTWFIPNKAFGSALKLLSHSTTVNLAVYSAIIFLLIGNTQRILNLAHEFWSKVSQQVGRL